MPRLRLHRPRSRRIRPARLAIALAGTLVLATLAGPSIVATAAPGPASLSAQPVGFWDWLPWWHRPVHRPRPPVSQPPVAPSLPATSPAPMATAHPAPSVTSTATDPAMGGMPGMTNTAPASSTSTGSGGTYVNPYVPIDASKIPKGSAGSGEKLLRAGGPRGDSDNGEFRTVCTYSHMAFDDPIVKPGQPGASHLHTFFGNTGANAYSTADSIGSSGNSTCRGGILNRSAYWTPELIDTRTGTPITPTHIDGYYKNGFGGLRPEQIHPLPQGLRMIAGNAMATTPQQRQVGQWGCDDGTDRPYVFWDHVPDYCAAGDVASFEVDFPQCWDGRNLDSADHRDHMAYTLDGQKGCPATHPVAIPAISIIVHWPVPSGASAKDLRLSSDMYPTSSPGGYSWHGDWFGGWDEATMQSWVKNCNNAGKNCYSDLIADGQSLYGER